MDAEHVQVETTEGSREGAQQLADSVVRERLAACAQVLGPITSSFRWEGQVDQDEEFLVLIKTAADRYDTLATRIAELHSYDEPEIIAGPITRGSESFLSWITAETRTA